MPLSLNATDVSPTGSVTSFCLSLWLRRLVLKGNKGGFKAAFPKNDMLFYSRKQPKEQEAAEDKTSLQMSAHGDACRHLLGEKGGVPLD